MDISLVIMAAGMGSRFGGLKQMTAISDDGRVIMDFSILDAKKAGFTKIIFIIKREFYKEFKILIGNKTQKFIKVSYVFQDIKNIKAAHNINRVKPFGTAHAVYCAKDFINEPFAVINADDFYGYDAFYKMAQQLKSNTNDYCMVGYKLKNTLTQNGTVSRGVCVYKNGYLNHITECHDIHEIINPNSANQNSANQNSANQIVYKNCDKYDILPSDTYVSMNMWGFGVSFLDFLEIGLENFLETTKDIETDEYYLPFAVDRLIKSGDIQVRFLKTDAKWIGITYKEDIESARLAINELIKNGEY